jgi:hypothetical protein
MACRFRADLLLLLFPLSLLLCLQAFPRKLFEILCHEPRDIIGWTDGGDSFIIKDMDTFVVHVLMKYFRHQARFVDILLT